MTSAVFFQRFILIMDRTWLDELEVTRARKLFYVADFQKIKQNSIRTDVYRAGGQLTNWFLETFVPDVTERLNMWAANCFKLCEIKLTCYRREFLEVLKYYQMNSIRLRLNFQSVQQITRFANFRHMLA